MDEPVAPKKEEPFTKSLLTVEEEDMSISSDTFMSAKEGFISSGDEIEDASDQPESKYDGQIRSEKSSDGGYASSSDEEKGGKELRKRKPTKLKLSGGDDQPKNEIYEKFRYNEMPTDIQRFITGIDSGLPNEYNPPVDTKPDWLDMEKFKLGQDFAKKYFVGVNISEMLSLYMLFALPDGLETLIFTKKSSTPFTSFRRYLSTVLRVTSWYDYNIWDKNTLGYKNIKDVRRMHVNVSKRINSVPYEELKTQVTLEGSTNNSPVWSNLKDIIRDDFKDAQSGCPFVITNTKDKTEAGKVFVNQLDMGTTQFGFMGLIITRPEKFGAARATKEELEGFVHLWRCIGYLLGTEDKYNFCAGNFEEVIHRSHAIIDQWVRPNFLHVTEEWEHMSRCLSEGMGYVASPEVPFEVSLIYMCHVLDVPAPRLYRSLSWSQKLSFYFLKFLMTTATRLPGVMAMLNWFARRSIAKAAEFTPEELKKLENKTYDYQITNTEKYWKIHENNTFSRVPIFGLVFIIRLIF